MRFFTKSASFKIFATAMLIVFAQNSYSCKKCKPKCCTEEKQVKSTNVISEKIVVEVNIGEMIDKITILEIKNEKIKDSAKLVHIKKELETLSKTRDEKLVKNLDKKTAQKLDELTAQLLKINKALWIIEDDIRDKERKKCFDEEFITIARSVYYTNDDRCRVKRAINDLLGSRLIEEKSYAAY